MIRGTRTRQFLIALLVPDESLHSWSFLLRDRQKYILYPEESNTPEGRGHGAGKITACGVKWRRHDSSQMKAEVGGVGLGGCLCCAANNTHYAAAQLRHCLSLPFFRHRRKDCGRGRETFLSMFDEELQSERISVFCLQSALLLGRRSEPRRSFSVCGG